MEIGQPITNKSAKMKYLVSDRLLYTYSPITCNVAYSYLSKTFLSHLNLILQIILALALAAVMAEPQYGYRSYGGYNRGYGGGYGYGSYGGYRRGGYGYGG